ncbi:MAG: WXG100 family type VII secretion target [Lachnospiraceae bacterium]|nr:WXG100 family type VII secretion target [Lachnospiraceae bacterium]
MGWRADVSKLKQRARELAMRASELKAEENALNGIIAETRTYWEGIASDEYRKQVSVLSDKVKRTRNKISSSADELRRLASYIESVESERTRAARDL